MSFAKGSASRTGSGELTYLVGDEEIPGPSDILVSLPVLKILPDIAHKRGQRRGAIDIAYGATVYGQIASALNGNPQHSWWTLLDVKVNVFESRRALQLRQKSSGIVGSQMSGSFGYGHLSSPDIDVAASSSKTVRLLSNADKRALSVTYEDPHPVMKSEAANIETIAFTLAQLRL